MAHRPRWTLSQVTELFEKPLLDLLFEAQQVHRQHFDPRQVQVSTLLSIKTGACPEDCKYCPQSSRYKTGLEAERLMEVEQVLESARKAKAAGSTRFCMGAAWKNPHERDMPYLEQMVQGVKAMGLEACMTLGTLSESQAQRLANAGLDYYNHNLDTSPEFYGNIITTRTYQERLDTLEKVRDAGIKVCSGGIVGLGETVKDSAGFYSHHCGRADHDANLLRAPFCRTRADERTDSGDVLYGRRKLDFLRLQTADHAESGRR